MSLSITLNARRVDDMHSILCRQLIYCTQFAKFDPDRIEYYPTKLSPARYAFVGDVQKACPNLLAA